MLPFKTMMYCEYAVVLYVSTQWSLAQRARIGRFKLVGKIFLSYFRVNKLYRIKPNTKLFACPRLQRHTCKLLLCDYMSDIDSGKFENFILHPILFTWIGNSNITNTFIQKCHKLKIICVKRRSRCTTYLIVSTIFTYN